MNTSKDINLKAPRANFYFKYLEWEASFFGKPAYLLVPEQSILKPHPSIAKAMAKYFKKTFITAKLPTSTNPRVISFLCDAGFRYIDTEIILQYRGDTVRELRRKDNNLTIRMLSENKGLAYTQFGSSFTLTRFHRDPNIAVDKANQVWIEYLKNYILSPQRNIFVACYGKKIIAVFLVNLNKEKRKAYLFYVSVLKQYRNKGAGSLLINEICRRFSGYNLCTGTQAENIPALNFYLKNGFTKIIGTNIVLHRWGNNGY